MGDVTVMPPSRRSHRLVPLIVVLLLLGIFWHPSDLRAKILTANSPPLRGTMHDIPINSHTVASSVSPSASATAPTATPHPIDKLVNDAERVFNSLLHKETQDLNSAARAYRKLRGRHPPPGFDVWYNFTKERNAVIIEEFWDHIYHDLAPFWAISPSQIRTDARAYDMVVRVREGKADTNTGWFWHQIWADMINSVSNLLPDMVIPLNAMDEPRLLVPWEQIADYISRERESRREMPLHMVESEFRGWHMDDDPEGPATTELDWTRVNPYSLVRLACPPDSLVREMHELPLSPYLLRRAQRIFLKRSQTNVDYSAPHSFAGLVENYTMSSSLCHQPDLGRLHGALIHPNTANSSRHLIPLFGGSKFSTNNEILLPAPMYWINDGRFTGDFGSGVDWEEKQSKAIWRGTATGGCNTAANWRHFHRHRFVYMTNWTKYRLADSHSDQIFNPLLRMNSMDKLRPLVQKHFAKWLDSSADTAFIDLFCEEPETDGTCWYTSDEFAVAEQMGLSEHFNYKYLPDIDGNSFSGRYRAFLQSTSLPIKATLYREWLDTRLVAWKHFVPMDNRFGDFYRIMEYFRGFEGLEEDDSEAAKGHDGQAKKIAMDGMEWSNRVLRKADMQIYVLRLLLEYARVTDDKRDVLGWVKDLKEPEN